MSVVSISEFHLNLRQALSQPLPGIDAQSDLAIVNRKVFTQVPSAAKQAAVCAVLYPHENQVRLAYIQRARHDNDRHSGQVSFPGGQVEDIDKTLQDTAIRELFEETGIQANSDQVLGELTSLYIPVSNFQVHPFVIGLDEKPTVLRQESEVDEIFGFNLDKLLKAQILRKKIAGQGFVVQDAPYFELDERTLWGATAMMTNELLAVVRAMGF